MPHNDEATHAKPSGHRWKVLGVGVAANASFAAVFQGIPMAAVFMRSDYHLSNEQLGLVLGLLGLGIAISEVPWGLLTDRWGDRKVLLAGLGGTALALGLMVLIAVPHDGTVPAAWWLGAWLAGVGLLGGSVNGASGRAVMTWFAEGERGLAMSVRQTAVPLGGGFGALVLPALASWQGFDVVFGLLSLLCAVSLYFTWRWLHEPPTLTSLTLSKAVKTTDALPDGRHPLHDAAVWRFVAGIGLLCAPQFAVLTFATIFLHDFAQAGVALIAATMFTVQFGAMVSRVWSGRWTDQKKNRREYLRLSAALSVVAFAALALGVVWAERAGGGGGAVAWLVGLLVVAGVCVSAWQGVAFTELATIVGKQRTGSALGMANTCVFVSLFFTPLAIPWILSISSWTTVWLAAAVCSLIVIPLLPKPDNADLLARLFNLGRRQAFRID
ncbi:MULTISPECIES: MFS transporter [Thiomonas]|uniref:MFS transporter n=1 Tax=Thiomonas arsenitoxydans (strain DSM 22701 / CIP 110005 / 3As) TaxID=426114 RepID=A0A8I1MYC7_THIA3|nr:MULTISPECIES: MFS transporter [Thiomonas]CQR44742.1 Major facilitator superfamily (MFS) transporter [Thiomonas sp. CB3]MBN8744589.1 MFS transporter [Thiomonas arsenitoxydans]CDW92513.1 Major facilitator superfamily MFS_1 [Thiomonas sp. CB2]VDY05790.1 Major facilitator superfamily MFS_1 [Thiomonas sp. Bio17B3]VDY10911.1 Major facilitator superfamily MFS_1 [Thiomonas sp. Sup16B3]